MPSTSSLGIPITYVPARNTIFLSIAASYAEKFSIRDIFIGVNAIDYSGYPDCRRETITSLKKTISLGLDKKVQIHTPLMDKNKADIWRLSYDLGGDKFHKITFLLLNQKYFFSILKQKHN